jgi:hypothetical protein
MLDVSDVVVDDSNIIINYNDATPARDPEDFHTRILRNKSFRFNYINDTIQYNQVIDDKNNNEYNYFYGKIFKFLNAGITFTFWSINEDFGPDPDGFWSLVINVDKGPLNFGLHLGAQEFMGDHASYIYLLQNIERIYKEQVRKAGRNLSSLQRVGKNRNLPHNIEAVTAGFLTGINKTSIKGQQNKLQQQLGISLAPRARKTRKHRR